MTKQELERAFGQPFTTKKKVKDALQYSTYEQVRPFFHGLQCIGNSNSKGARYLTSDVAERVMRCLRYGD